MISLPARYSKVVATLSGGGMSQAMVCEDANLMRRVVVKALKSGIDEKRLLDELAALQAIRSRYVVQVYDVIYGSAGKIVAIVEEYLSGAELSPIPTPHSLDGVLRTIYPIAAGIAEIHAHGLIHRDIKPDNMRYDSEGNLRIFDFGLAKLSSSPGTAQLFFSHGYTAPEAFAKGAAGLHTFTNGVDVFAFGATCLWLLNSGKIPADLMAAPPKLPSAETSFAPYSGSLNPDICAVLDRCLSTDPADRPAMDEVASAFSRHLLRGKHRLLITLSGQEFIVDAGQRTATIRWPTHNPTEEISIRYDGFDFKVASVMGSVAINNKPVKKGDVLRGAAVIVLGVSEQPGGRISVTADISHPEVVL